MTSFKPVTGDALNAFDKETIELFTKRDHDPRLSYLLTSIPRRERHDLPVIVDGENTLM